MGILQNKKKNWKKDKKNIISYNNLKNFCWKVNNKLRIFF